MVTGRAARSILLSWAFAWAAAGCASASFDAGRARTIAVGQSREQVRAVMGQPDHMTKTLEHPKSCAERWTYGEAPREALLVDFDGQGRVCDVAFTPTR